MTATDIQRSFLREWGEDSMYHRRECRAEIAWEVYRPDEYGRVRRIIIGRGSGGPQVGTIQCCDTGYRAQREGYHEADCYVFAERYPT